VVLDGSQFDYSRREVPQMAKKRLKMYAAKLVSPKAIFRFLTFRSDYGRIWAMAKTLLLRAVDKAFRRKKVVEAKAIEAAKPDAKPRVGLSVRFVKAAREAMQRSKVLFIYGNNDGFLWEFTDLYAAAHLSQAKRDEVLRVVEHANHMFQWNEWQQQAFALIQDWLTSIVLLM
jgi:pimeloyl-ACP methyl ester carboxylesterase